MIVNVLLLTWGGGGASVVVLAAVMGGASDGLHEVVQAALHDAPAARPAPGGGGRAGRGLRRGREPPVTPAMGWGGGGWLKG